MSKQAIAEFLKQVSSDKKMQEDLSEFAGQHGFEFTANELKEADLEHVAGGIIEIDYKLKKL
jgi:hypothetical protein